ncbi:hypothetical protein [Magnetospirillum sp. 15-1]|uniref:hypothetical protein n=1 Tax=Magnetospirillum sp. 15-1 TaxID=1979370 RepID=UPI0011413CF6|nr:hypothetical protein [Magnetospirillum sp. 15-1]
MGQSSIAGGAGASLPPARPVRWSLARKVSLALLSILLFTLVVTAFFAYYKFESVYSAQVQSRYSFVVFTIKKKVEDSLNLGFALRQLRQVQEIIEREKSRDSQILAVEVYDYRGEVLFDTDRGAIGTKVSESLAEAIRSGMQQSFSVVDEDNLIVGLPLVNNLGKVEGGVVLRYPIAYVEKGVSGLLTQLLKSIAIALVGASVVAVVGLYALFGGVGRKLGSMEKTMGEVLAVGGQAIPEGGGDSFEARFAEFVAKTRETIDHVKDATDEVGRLDRLM